MRYQSLHCANCRERGQYDRGQFDSFQLEAEPGAISQHGYCGMWIRWTENGMEVATTLREGLRLWSGPFKMDGDSTPPTKYFICSECRKEFLVVALPGAVSEHPCGMKVRWTGMGPEGIEYLRDPGTPRAVALLIIVVAVVAAPTVLALIVGGSDIAILAAIGTIIALFVWRVFLRPGALFLSDIVDNVRGVPPDDFASRKGKWW